MNLTEIIYKIAPTCRVNYKMIRSGDFVECIHYNNGIELNSYPKTKKDSNLPQKVQDDLKSYRWLEYQRRKSQRVMEKIIRAIRTNFTKDSVFITLTFGECMFDITDLSVTNKKFNTFCLKLRKRYPDFKYIAVPEFQQRGAVHYHMIVNLPYISHFLLKKLWVHGRHNIKDVYNEQGMAFYFVKYLTKNGDTPQLWGRRTLFMSKKMLNPKIYYGSVAHQAFDWFPAHGKLPIHVSSYYNEYTGVVLRYLYYHPLAEQNKG